MEIMEKDVLVGYKEELMKRNLSENTREIYMRQAAAFIHFLNGRKVSRELLNDYKNFLIERYSPKTIVLYEISVNLYLKYIGSSLRMEIDKYQQVRSLHNVITANECRKLLEYTNCSKRKKYYLIIMTIMYTGIRISELSYITYKALTSGDGYVLVRNKGKVREIYISRSLNELLLQYCIECHITDGVVFRGKNDNPISRNTVWRMLKIYAENCGIPIEHVYPHSFRHHFAKEYMNKYRNLPELSDILGHSSIETTRIYTSSTSDEKRERLENLYHF